MKKLTIAILVFASLSASADAQTLRHWWNHHHILCMCIGNPPVIPGGN